MNSILEEKNNQKNIVEQIKNIEQPYRNILFAVYIQGKSLVKVASDMNYSYVDICRKHGTALNKFDELEI
ncbi:MAG: hypothetical protein HFJ40_05930 [Clostridia bacterium]|nr:hypothetical protein [Clostridia bacterium]